MANGNRTRGAALAFVIWSLAVIGLLVAALLSRGAVEREEIRASASEDGARSLARAGASCVIRRFLADTNDYNTPALSWLAPAGAPLPSFDGGTITARVYDCGSRIDLNLASPAQLALLFDGKSAPAEAILDWRDADHDARPGGAEDEYYGGLDPPLQAGNGLFRCPEEVRLVKGMGEYGQLLAEEATVYGRANPNLIGPDVWEAVLKETGLEDWVIESLVEQFSTAREEADKEHRIAFAALEDLLSLPGLTSRTLDLLRPCLECRGRVNPNLAGERSLRAALSLLSEGPDEAALILAARSKAPFTSLQEVQSVLAAKGKDPIGLDWLGQVFTLQTTLMGLEVTGTAADGASLRLEAVVERYHPPSGSGHWQARILSWRESPVSAGS